jgi:hypothetical protein
VSRLQGGRPGLEAREGRDVCTLCTALHPGTTRFPSNWYRGYSQRLNGPGREANN